MAARWESDALPTEHLLVPRTWKKQFVHNPYPREVEIRGEQSWIRCGEAAPRASGKAPRGHCGQDEGMEDALSIVWGTSSTGSRAGAALLPPAQSILRFSTEYL